MIWLDYTVESYPDGSFSIRGDYPGEVMGKNKDGTDKEYSLYKPGDVFMVNEYGILVKTDEVNVLFKKYEEGLKNGNRSSTDN